MILKEGVKIYTKLPIEERILLSSGIEIASTINGIPCYNKAYIPKLPWRVPTEEEKSILFDTNHTPDINSTVSIIKLPLYLRNQLRKSNIQTISSKRSLDNLSITLKFKKAYQSLVQYIDLFQTNDDNPVIHTLGQGPSGLANASYDFKRGIYVGLHVDSWDMKQLNERHLSRNRILINLGKDPRYFMFINQEMQNISDFIPLDSLPKQNNFDEMFKNVERFFLKNSNYPVIKIKLNPFEGYIAPTDNIIHDGNTEGQDILDVFLTLRSYYNGYPRISLFNRLKAMLHL